MNAKSNKLLEQCGIFSGIIGTLLLLLSMFMILSRNSWENGLRAAVENVLPSPEYFVGKEIPVARKSNDAICFELSHNKDTERMPTSKQMALVMRITTYYGPLPAVFSYEGGQTRFEGIAYLKSSLKKEFLETENNRQMSFWLSTAKNIFEEAAQNVSEKDGKGR